MMKPTIKSVLEWLSLPAVLILPHTAFGAVWQLTVGSQRPDCQFVEGKAATAACESRQGMAFEPNEIWVHPGDSITWTHRTAEGHTVTLLKSGQIRPSFVAGCPGSSPDHSDYDSTQC